ncbi:DUF4446 family protein [Paenibacillus ginsengarvi]|uniref:DUF4446 family protein n=2 Tax=Paenibacillus ginsengarvi TaxID=400777 RepID=A0A3B0CP59_9BACL|nr:DUF4446 family protein [Paenibacillus ginsengarvi]
MLAGCAVLALLFIVVLIVLIALSVKLSRLRKSYEEMMGGVNETNIEQMLLEYKQKIDMAVASHETQNRRISDIESKLKTVTSKIGVVRYNAFGERGSDLSFSVAFLSDNQDGVVLSGIHNRDETHMYAKPISAGQSVYRLTPEEKDAIIQSLELVESK